VLDVEVLKNQNANENENAKVDASVDSDIKNVEQKLNTFSESSEFTKVTKKTSSNKRILTNNEKSNKKITNKKSKKLSAADKIEIEQNIAAAERKLRELRKKLQDSSKDKVNGLLDDVTIERSKVKKTF